MKLTKTEKQMRIAGLLYAVAFIFTGFVEFILLPDMLIGYINLLSETLFPTLPAYPLGENKFWLAMTVSMMVGVTITSLLIFKDVRKFYTMAIPLVAMKFSSAFLGMGFFTLGMIMPETKWNTLANLVIFTTDVPLAALMLYFYMKVSQEQKNGLDHRYGH